MIAIILHEMKSMHFQLYKMIKPQDFKNKQTVPPIRHALPCRFNVHFSQLHQGEQFLAFSPASVVWGVVFFWIEDYYLADRYSICFSLHSGMAQNLSSIRVLSFFLKRTRYFIPHQEKGKEQNRETKTLYTICIMVIFI